MESGKFENRLPGPTNLPLNTNPVGRCEYLESGGSRQLGGCGSPSGRRFFWALTRVFSGLRFGQATNPTLRVGRRLAASISTGCSLGGRLGTSGRRNHASLAHGGMWEFCGKHNATMCVIVSKTSKWKSVHPCGQIMNKLLKMLVFRKERSVQYRVIRNQ
jgi:hypothetical protein